MRKLIIIALLASLGYWHYRGDLELPLIGERERLPVISNDNPAGIITVTQGRPGTPSAALQSRRDGPATAYRCDGRQHCSQMGSYEEASFFLRNCPNTRMDGDSDGVPCERQFGR